MLGRVELDSLFSVIDSALESKDYEKIPLLAEELDAAIRSVMASGVYDKSEALFFLNRLSAVIDACNKQKRQVLLESAAVSKGAAGIKAYKKV